MHADNNSSVLICPLCNTVLSKCERRFVCQNQHSFDLARQGYVNLLPVQNKKSKNPGDNRTMIDCRKRFMEKGFYDLILQPCQQLITDILDQTIDKAVLLDSGCGDGYFTEKLFASHTDRALTYGMDISKEAVKIAAKRNDNITWFVASSKDIPVGDACIDILLKVNAPLDYQNIRSKLNKNSVIISITPGKYHLFDLKKLIYADPRVHNTEKLPENYKLINSMNLEAQLELKSTEDIQDLFMMTPLFWNSSKNIQAKVSELSNLHTCIAFDINVWGVA